MSDPKTTKTKGESSILPQIEQLLSEQTTVILRAVDEKLTAQDKRLEEKFVAQEIRLLAAVDKRFQKMEERFAKSLVKSTRVVARPTSLCHQLSRSSGLG